MSADYKRMYLQMARKVDMAVTLLDEGGDAAALRLLLLSALEEAEEIYLETDDTVENI